MTSHCDSNPAQYERNRRFGHLVHALDRAAGGAKLPSVGLCLNASKTVSFLVKGCNDISRSLVSQKAQNNVTLLAGRLSFAGWTDRRTSPVCPYGAIVRRRDLTAYDSAASNGQT
ncbi:uncharacterized protein LOC120360034 [Solenopsis invicta]|uniref:uncharacterized protein LOC120360034 n=1 Tax=Solenopsis invicta TaxID=13686 RepID=UPI00193DA445|nr:uncharacterized protein LOC120360034 [Solenopsis invicta]